MPILNSVGKYFQDRGNQPLVSGLITEGACGKVETENRFGGTGHTELKGLRAELVHESGVKDSY